MLGLNMIDDNKKISLNVVAVEVIRVAVHLF